MIDVGTLLKKKRGRRRKVATAIAVAYIRVSTEEQANGPEAQRAALEAYAVAQGLTIARWCSDIGISGGAPLDERPALLEAFEALKAEKAAVLLVAKRDRLARDTMAAAMVTRLIEREGCRIESADGAGNGDSPEAVMMRGMIDLFAQYERACIRARTKAALAAKKKRGERVGQVPYGYRVAADGSTLEPEPVEQAIINRIRAELRDGWSLTSITDQLNADGVPARGKRWHRNTVLRIAERERVAA